MLNYVDIAIGFATVMLAVSLVATICVQSLLAFLGSRGATLHWGFAILLTDLGSTVGPKLADQILTHPLVSDSILNLHPQLVNVSSKFTWWRRASAVRFNEFQEILARLPDGAPIATAPDLGLRFQAVTDRAAQRFAMKSRLWSIFFGITLVFLVNLDAIDLANRLYRDSQLRAGLLNSSSEMLKAAVTTSGTSVAPTSEAIQATMKGLMTGALRDVAGPSAPEVLTRAQGEAYLRQTVPNESSDAKIKAFGNGVEGRVSALSKQNIRTLSDISDVLSRAGFVLFNPSPAWPAGPKAWAGRLIAAALLTLGAPFWFNALKGMSTLRPVVASRVKDPPPAN